MTAARCLLVSLAGLGCSGAPPAAALGPIVRVSDSPRSSETFLNTARCVAVTDDGAIHVAWLDIVQPEPFTGHAIVGQLFYSRSTDDGATFSAPAPVTAVVNQIGMPKLAAAGNLLFMTWHQSDGALEQIRLARATSSGAAWEINPAPLGPGTFPSIDAWSDGASPPDVHVAWSNSQTAAGVSEVYLANSIDGGVSFAPPVMVSSDDGRSSWTAAVAAWDAVVHVAWTDDRFNVDAAGQPYDCGVVGGGATCHEEEYYRRSVDRGASFASPEVRLTSDPPGMPKYSWAPSIVARDQDVHLAYFDQRTGAFQIYYRASHDAGASWGDEQLLTAAFSPQPAGGWWRPSLTARAAELHIAFWKQEDTSLSTVWTIQSLDGGASWSSPLLLSAGSAALQPAALLAPSGATHFVWYDSPAGREEIFYRRLTASGRD